MAQRAPKALLDRLAQMENLRDPSRTQAKRQFHRFVVRGDAELMEQEPSQTERRVVPVLLRDLGRGGVGFVCARKLEANSFWHINFINRGYVVAQQAVLIRHCQEVESDVFLVGGQFCAAAGLLCLAGIDPNILRQQDSDRDGVSAGDFVEPQNLTQI